mmetsp:Transcript_39157/g.77019  ORF Transcript_39157/g.77019 Transcript_39157/m.77019 type:complete len:410 (+) Transcript_39157:391-1620(+)
MKIGVAGREGGQQGVNSVQVLGDGGAMVTRVRNRDFGIFVGGADIGTPMFRGRGTGVRNRDFENGQKGADMLWDNESGVASDNLVGVRMVAMIRKKHGSTPPKGPTTGLWRLRGEGDGCTYRSLGPQLQNARCRVEGIDQPKKAEAGIAAEWALSNKTKNRLAHVYNGNGTNIERLEQQIEKVTKDIEKVEGDIEAVLKNRRAIRTGQGQGRTAALYGENFFWKNEDELKAEEEQLRKEKEQLREKENLLLAQQQQASASSEPEPKRLRLEPSGETEDSRKPVEVTHLTPLAEMKVVPTSEPKFVGIKWLDATFSEAKELFDTRDLPKGKYRKPPIVISRFSRGGKTRALEELGKRFSDTVPVIFVSFNDATPLSGDEQNAFEAVLSRIGWAAVKGEVREGLTGMTKFD